MLFVIIGAWLILSTFVYAFTVRPLLAHVQAVAVHVVAGIVFAALLSPGGAVGNGVAPFPGGLMCILRLLHVVTGERGTFFNCLFWALTATIFIALTLLLREQK